MHVINILGHKIVFLTAGLGEENFVKAAERIKNGLSVFTPNSQVLMLNNSNLKEFCPEIFQKYGNYLMSEIRGYGYFSWKSEIVYRALQGDFGEYDFVVWIDAGCEINTNYLSRFIFLYWILLSKIRGYVLWSLKTPEPQYSKFDVLKQFKNLKRNQLSDQIQATFFILNPKKTKALGTKWFTLSLADIKNLDDSKSTLGEAEDFVAHRHDQSLLSLCAKSFGMNKRIRALPTGKSNGVGRIYSKSIPVWAARNRGERYKLE